MSADEAVAFGHRLRELRERAGLTQRQLAERAGMHRQGVAKLELGEREPSWSTLLALAGGLGVDLNAFGQGPPTDLPPRGPGRPPKRSKQDVPGPVASSLPEEQKAMQPYGGHDADRLPPAQNKPQQRRPRKRRDG
jgi:transcriptional regulator with XRE-family HTH domain